MNKLILHSYAKLNLYLEVVNKRRDGYHNIKTIFERIDLSDKLILKSIPDKEIKIICDNPEVPCDNSNLCYRSAKLLQDSFKVNRGAQIKIIKRIPLGAGLGGGSSNAAFVLLGLNKLWKLGLSKATLARLAKKIGSDVAFFIYNSPFAKGTGRGDRIELLEGLNGVRLWHILIVPGIKVSTAVIYRKWDMQKIFKLTPTPIVKSTKKLVWGLTRPKYNVKILTSALEKKDLGLIGKVLFNSLEQVSVKLYPQIKRVKEWLTKKKVQSILMSGSGPAVFGVVSSRKEAVSLYRQLKQENRAWRVFFARTF